MSTHLQQVQQVYLAFFARPADPAGLAYWGNILATDPTAVPTIAATFANTPEYAANFGGKSSAGIVDTLFLNLFGHTADATARASWAAQLDAGANIGNVMTSIAAAAESTDRAALNAKLAAATAFTAAIDTSAEIAAYQTQAGIATGKEYIAYVDDANTQVSTTTPYALNLVTSDIVAGRAWSMPGIVEQQVQELYVAYFSRPADTSGFAYWSELLDGDPANARLQIMSNGFSQSAEYKAEYSQSTNALKVNAVYENLFSRPGEAAGIKYWADLMDQGKITIDNAVTAIADGAQTTDLYAYEAKVSVARAFTDALNTPAEQQAYSGAAVNASVIAYLAAVKDQPTYDAAIAPAAIDALIASFTPSPTSAASEPDAAQLVGIAPAAEFGWM